MAAPSLAFTVPTAVTGMTQVILERSWVQFGVQDAIWSAW